MAEAPLTIGQVAARLGVSADTVRRMEASGVLIPKRTSGGQRRYSLRDVERVACQAESESEATGAGDRGPTGIVEGNRGTRRAGANHIDELKRYGLHITGAGCGKCLQMVAEYLEDWITAENVPEWVGEEQARRMVEGFLTDFFDPESERCGMNGLGGAMTRGGRYAVNVMCCDYLCWGQKELDKRKATWAGLAPKGSGLRLA